jgi:hypothetical protein
MDEPIQSNFSIEDNRIASNLGTDIVGKGLLHNFTTSSMALKNGLNFWRGGCEKNPLLVQTLLETFSKPGDVILDCNTSTGKHNSTFYLINNIL